MLVLASLLLNILPASLLYSAHPPRHQPAPAPAPAEESAAAPSCDKAASIYRSPRLWCCIFSMASTTVGYTNFGLYLPLHLHTALGLSTTQAATFISVFAVRHMHIYNITILHELLQCILTE